MIDTHIHILPGIDDGAQDLLTALEMARQALADGVTTVIATPHFRPPVDYVAQLSARSEAAAVLREALRREGLALEVLLGAECTSNGHLFTQEIPQMPALLMPTPTGSPPLALVELPLELSLEHAGDLLFQAQLAGYRLILAHPERYHGFSNGMDFLKGMLDRGAYLQFNQGGLRTGFFHQRLARQIAALMEYAPEQVLLASDAHDAVQRPAVLTPARKAVERMLGEAFWAKLTCENPRRLFLG